MPQSLRPQDALALGGMSAHAQLAFAHVRPTLGRPHLLSVSKRFCSLRQYLRQLRQLLGTQLGLRTWCWSAAQSHDPLRLHSVQPLNASKMIMRPERATEERLAPYLEQMGCRYDE